MNLLDDSQLVFSQNQAFQNNPRQPSKPPTLAEALAARGVSAPAKEEPIDVAGELEYAFRSAKRLLAAAEHDEATPLNQKSQIIGALNTVLASITKSRTEVYSAEKNRLMEAALIATLKQFPEMQAAFMEKYKEALSVTK